MEDEGKKLSGEEIEKMLGEAEELSKARRRRNPNRKKKPKFRLDWLIAVVVVVALLFGAFKLVSYVVSKSASSENTASSDDNPLECEKYPEISDVVKNYLEAFLIEDDTKRAEVLAQYVDNMGDIESADIGQNKYVESYSGIECYTKEGPYEGTYVVYAYYQTTYKNISQSAPSLTTLYVLRDQTTDNVYVHNGISTEVSDYIAEVTADDDVQALFEAVDQEFQEALDSSERLKEFIDKLKVVSETTASASETSESGTTAAQTTVSE